VYAVINYKSIVALISSLFKRKSVNVDTATADASVTATNDLESDSQPIEDNESTIEDEKI